MVTAVESAQARTEQPPPPRAAIGVRDATRADVDAIQRVARRSWREAYAGLLTDAEIRHYLRWTYNRPTLWADIAAARRGRGHFLVAERSGAVGYLHYVAAGVRGAELRRLYVDPDAVGAGVGSALLRELHRRLAPGSAYMLRVHPGNSRALAFYRRKGFEEAGRVESPPGGRCDVLLRMIVPRDPS